MAVAVTDDPPPSHAETAAANYAFARAMAIGLNALLVGLIATGFFAVGLIWLQRSSGIELERRQYLGVLVFLLVLSTLCAYLVFDFAQSKKEALIRKRRAAAKPPGQKTSNKPAGDDWGAILEARLRKYEPLFADGEENESALAPSTAPEPSPAPAVIATSVAMTPRSVAVAPATSAPKDLSVTLFAQGVTAAIASLDDAPTLFLQFGIHLFMAGAAGVIAARGNLSAAQGRLVLETMLVELGVSKRRAQSFAANANTFAQIPHFRAPVEAGFRAMAHFNETGFVELAVLPEMLAQWQIQDSICHAPEIMTFVTTSVGVPPPGVTIAPEDQQRVIRAHATVITEIVHRFQGREIHNLGNGRILVFDDATRAIRAATQCMEALDRFARTNPTLIVAPRIGVDTDIAAIVASDYVSAALPRTVTIATIASAKCVCCTEAAKDDATEVIEFEPVLLSDTFADMPALFAAKWDQAPVEATGAAPIEYRQVGALSN
jgi:hypothetical protein